MKHRTESTTSESSVQSMYEKRTTTHFDASKAIGATLLATALASGGATAAEGLAHVHAPGFHETIDTRHTATVDSDKTEHTTVTTLKDGSQLYIPAMYESTNQADLPLSKTDLADVTASIVYSLENTRKNTMYTDLETANAALDVLQDPAQPDHLNILSIINNADKVSLSKSQAAELQDIATRHNVPVATLISEYKNGSLHGSATDVQTLESLLVTNPNTSVHDIALQKDGKDITATLYEANGNYTLVAERTMKTEKRGGELPVVVLPIPVPWFRRRTSYALRGATANYGNLAKYNIQASKVQYTPASASDREFDDITSGRFALAQTPVSFDNHLVQSGELIQSDAATLRGPRFENGAFYGKDMIRTAAAPESTAPHTPESNADEPAITAETVDVEEASEVAPEVSTEEPATPAAETLETPDETPVETPDEETPTPETPEQTETDASKRALRVPKWLIPVVIGASLVGGSSVIASHHASKTPPVATSSDTPTATPSASADNSQYPHTSTTPPASARATGNTPPLSSKSPTDELYGVLYGNTIAGQSVTSVNGAPKESTTIGLPTDISIMDRLSETRQNPVPVAAESPKTPAPTETKVSLGNGEGGETLMRDLGKNPAEWYPIADRLLQQYPDYFYKAADGVRITKPGLVPDDVIATIDTLAK